MYTKKWLVVFASLFYLTACEQGIEKTDYAHNYLLISHQESLVNYNLDEQKTEWHYRSRLDMNKVNRNLFTVNQHTVYMPYESGEIAALDIASGQPLWQKAIDPTCTQSLGRAIDDDYNNLYRPLFMSQATVHNNMLYIASTSAIEPCFYAFDATTGEQLQSSVLPSRYNLFAPLANQYGVFTNGAIYLSAFASQPQFGLSERGKLTVEQPLYAPLQASGKWLFATSEKSQITAIDVSKTINTSELPITWQYDYLDDEYGIKPSMQQADEMLYMASYQQQYTVAENDALIPNYTLIIRAIEPKNGDLAWLTVLNESFLNMPEMFQVSSRYLVIQSEQELAFVDLKQRQLTAKFSVNDALPMIQSNIIEKTADRFVYLSGNQLIELDVTNHTLNHVALGNLPVTQQTDGENKVQIALLTKKVP